MKKTISLLLALCILTFAALPAFAATNPITVEPLRYTSIMNPQVFIQRSGTAAVCAGNVNIENAATTTMVLYLQISYDNGITYKDYYLVASEEFSGGGSFKISGSKQYLPSNYVYRAALYISVYDASGRLIDHAEKYSS